MRHITQFMGDMPHFSYVVALLEGLVSLSAINLSGVQSGLKVLIYERWTQTSIVVKRDSFKSTTYGK